MLLVALLATVAYLNSIPGEFVFDDKLITADPRINGLESFWRIFATDYWYKYIGTSGDLYRPLTIASYALNVMLAGLDSRWFHVVNILLHAATSATVVILADATLRDRPLAVVSGLLFAVHPVHTEAVTGIVGRAELLAALFLLSALYLHARRYRLRGMGPGLWLPVAGMLYFCALLSKETALVGPGLLLLVDAVQRVRPAWREPTPTSPAAEDAAWSVRRTLGVLALYTSVAALFLSVRFIVVGTLLQRPPAKSYYLLFGHPLETRLLTGFNILAIYTKLLFFPVTLSADYSYRQVVLSHSVDSAGPVLGMIVAAALVGGFALAAKRRAVEPVFALGFFAVAYSVVSNFIAPIGVLVAERLLYLPSVGFCITLAWAGVALSRRRPAAVVGWRRHVPAGVLVVVLALCGGRTFARNRDWRNAETLYRATADASPECLAAHYNYSAVLLMRRHGRGEALDLALQHLRKAYEIRQDHFPSLVNLTIVYQERGEFQKAREMALQALNVRPNSTSVKRLLAAIEARLRQRQND